MPWRPLPRIAFAVAIYPFQPASPADLPLELGDELYIIEEGGVEGAWYRGYLVAPPSLLAGLTSVKGQTLEARVFSGIFPRNCVEVREVLGDSGPNGPSREAEHIIVQHGQGRTNLSCSSGVSKNDDPQKERRVASMGRRLSAAKRTRKPSSSSLGTQELISLQVVKSSDSQNEIGQHPYTLATLIKSNGTALPLTPVSMSPRDPTAPRPPAPVPMLKIGDETPTSTSEPLVDEIASCLREWHSTSLHELLLSRRYSVLDKLSKLVQQLDLSRRQLLHGVLTNQELRMLREKTVWDLVSGNKALNNEIIVRDPRQRGRLLTGDDTSIEISKLQSVMSLLEKPPAVIHDQVNLNHMMVDFRGINTQSKDSPNLVVSLCTKSIGEPVRALTESFVIDVPFQDQINKTANSNKLRTLFTNLTANDIGESSGPETQLYLVIKVQANQLTQPASLMPSRTGTVRETAPLRKDVANSASTGSATLRGGRRSVMWAQSKLGGSSRHRSQNTSKLDQSLPSIDSEVPMEEEHHATTPTGLRAMPQQGPQYVKKTVGIAVISLKHFLGQEREMDSTVIVWSASQIGVDPQTTEDGGWDEIIRELMPDHTGQFERSKIVQRLRIRLHSFVSFDADSLIRRTPTLLHGIIETSKIGFSGAPTKPRSDIYITLVQPQIPSHALFSHPERGAVQLGSSLDMRNIQLTLEVRKSNGERIEHCIFSSSNSLGQTAWRTTAIERDGAWNQIIRLTLPSSAVPDAHLIMSIANAPGFPFALSWIPLWNHDAFLRDGKHAPLLYLYDKTTSSTEMGRGAYLDYPWDSKGSDRSPRIETLTGPVATLQLESYLCSTIFSQDQVLLKVLKWRDQADDQLLLLLRQLIFVPEIEIVKLVNEVFDALFGILVDRSGNDEFEDIIFNALVTVLGIVHDRRFNLGPLVDDYVANRFSYPFATPCLIRSYLRLLSSPTDYQSSRSLRATFKVGRQVLKFIITARKQQQAKEASIGITANRVNFNRDFTQIFAALQSMMREQSPTLIGTKTVVVQHMHTWLPELEDCFSQEDILQLAVGFVDACADVKGKLILHKLVLILNISNIFKLPEGDLKRTYNTRVADWLDPYWGSTDDVSEQYREQVRLCSSIVASCVDAFGPQAAGYFVKVAQSYRSIQHSCRQNAETLSLLFPASYPFPAKAIAAKATFDENLVELAALLARFSSEALENSAESTAEELEDVLSAVLESSISVLSAEAFPSSWLTLYVYHHRSILQMLEKLFRVISERYLPSPDDTDDFNTGLWRLFFTALLELVRSEALALETFPEQKRRAVWKIAGDVREQGAELLRQSWDVIGWEASAEDLRKYGLHRLGGYQVQYVPGLVGPIVELCLSVHAGLRTVAVETLRSMIISEWTLNEDLSVIQAEMVDCLDHLFKSRDINENAQQKLFIGELLDSFDFLAHVAEDPLWEAIKVIVSTIDELLELLVAVHSAGTTEAFRIMHTLRLMDFLRGMQKEDIFIQYVHQLAELQARSRNFTEAGLALRLHADLYDWNPGVIVGLLSKPDFPEQSAFERKERLYFDIIQYFEEGSAWGSALETYKELAEQYQHHMFDFAKLARTQRSTAKIYETIARGEGHSPRYFRVVYRGLGFPVNLRDRDFIFQGNGSERLSAFTDRLQQQHPAAQLVPHGDIDDVEGQFLQVSAVHPQRDLEHPLYQRSKLPQSTRDFLLSSSPNQFSVTSRRHTPKTSVRDQWVEKTVYSTQDHFPTILRRSEIVSVDVVALSPLQTALERTTRKTSELAILERRILDGDESSFTNMTDAIRTSVDPISATSVAQYRQLLRKPTSRDDGEPERGLKVEPQLDSLESALQIALVDFALTLRHCLTLYSGSSHDNVHSELVTGFSATFAPEIAILTPSAVPQVSQPIDQWLSSPPLPASFTPPVPSSEITPFLANGDSHDSPPVVHNSTPHAPPTNPRQTTSKSRLSISFLKRMNTAESKPTTNGFSSVSEDVHKDESPSISSSRATSPSGEVREKRGSRVSIFSEDGSRSPVKHREGSRKNSEPRPVTGQSAATYMTAGSTGRGGGLRKRLSTFGIGKKASKASFLGGGDGVLREE